MPKVVILLLASVGIFECIGWLHLPTNFNKYIVGKVVRLLFIIIVRALQNSTRGRFQLQLKHHHPELFLKRSFRLCCNFGQHHYYYISTHTPSKSSMMLLEWKCWRAADASTERATPYSGSKKSIFCEAPHSDTNFHFFLSLLLLSLRWCTTTPQPFCF